MSSSKLARNIIINERSLLDPCETLFYAVSSTSGRVVQYQVSVPLCIVPEMLNKYTMLTKKSDKVQQFTDLRILVDKMKTGGLDTEGLVPINMQALDTPEAS